MTDATTEASSAPGAGGPRTLRVFISSTFRDMQAERDELVKQVFPEIRRRCEERGVAWGEVDLRWGVTDEQKAEGQVLPICLTEIELSRPYFIGLLGERYGWVPDELPTDLIDQLGWLGEMGGRSVTELEILHGVLNDADMANHAFFYLRDPAYVDRLPPEEQVHLRELPTADEVAQLGPEQAEARAAFRRRQLVELKDRVRSSGFPVRDYADPQTLATAVRDDLLALLDRLYPIDAPSDPLDAQAAEQEVHAAALRSLHVGRAADTAALDQHAVGDGPPLVITGESGAGKSALVATWAHRLATDPAWAAVPMLVHHVGASGSSSDWSAVVRRLMGELDRRLDLALTVPDGGDDLRVAFAGALDRAAVGRRLVIVVDGLDQLDDREGALDLAWLPPEIPAGVRLVVTTLPGRPLDECRRRRFAEHHLDLLDPGGRRELTRRFLAQYAKGLDQVHEDRLAGAERAANPRYLRIVLDELRQHGDHFTLGDRIEHYLTAVTTDDLLEQVLARYAQDYDRDRPGLVADTFTLVAAARRGLAETELLDLLGTADGPLPRRTFSPLFLGATSALALRSGRVVLAHTDVGRAVDDRLLPTADARAAAHRRLAAYFAARPVTPRVADELPWQQAEAGDWDALAATLASPDHLEVAYRGDVLDVKAHWARLEASSTHRMDGVYAGVLADPAARPDTTWAVARLLTDGGYPEPALALHRAIVDGARARGDDKVLAAGLVNLGAALLDQHRLDDALAAFTEQETLARTAGDRNGLQISLGNQGAVWRAKGDRARALDLMGQEELLCRVLGDRTALQSSIANQGATLLDGGDLDGALARFTEQETLARQLGDPVLVGKALGAIATVASTRGDLDGALARYAEQETVSRRVGDLNTLAVVLGNQASILLQRGHVDRAVALATEEAALAERTGNRSSLARSLLVQAMAAVQVGDAARALDLLGRHEPVARELGTTSQLAQNYGVRALVRRSQGDNDGALADHIEEERLYRESGEPSGIATSLGNQGIVRQAQGDLQGAMALYAEQERIVRGLGDPSALQACLGNQAAAVLAGGDVNRGRSLLDEQERLCRQHGLTGPLAVCLGNQATVAGHLGDHASMMARLDEQARLLAELGDHAGLATARLNHGTMVMNMGDPAGAVASLTEAVQAARLVGDDSSLQMALGNLGLALHQSGRSDDAWPHLVEAEQICRRTNDLNGLQSAVGNQALVLHARHDDEAAVAKLIEQEQLCQQIGNAGSYVIAIANRGEVTAGLPGRRAEGIALLHQARQLAQQYGMAPMVPQIDALIRQLGG